jgi:hypothetical protein
MRRTVAICFCTVVFCPLISADCIPFSDAQNHIGELGCLSGKVTRVERGDRAVHYLDFCEDDRLCPLTVVVFAEDLKHAGDLRPLQGSVIEVHGAVEA